MGVAIIHALTCTSGVYIIQYISLCTLQGRGRGLGCGLGSCGAQSLTWCVCSLQGIDVRSMGRIFIGIIKCGAWGCFDEFNRLEEAVLSAVSMQIQTIQAALRSQAPTCQLLGREVGREEGRGEVGGRGE